jgi:hypothetical protein
LFEPAGHVAPVWQVFDPPASPVAEQHESPVAQSAADPQICVDPVGHAVPVWHALAAPAAPEQQT